VPHRPATALGPRAAADGDSSPPELNKHFFFFFSFSLAEKLQKVNTLSKTNFSRLEEEEKNMALGAVRTGRETIGRRELHIRIVWELAGALCESQGAILLQETVRYEFDFSIRFFRSIDSVDINRYVRKIC